jgi:hypothetical protein
MPLIKIAPDTKVLFQDTVKTQPLSENALSEPYTSFTVTMVTAAHQFRILFG